MRKLILTLIYSAALWFIGIEGFYIGWYAFTGERISWITDFNEWVFGAGSWVVRFPGSLVD